MNELLNMSLFGLLSETSQKVTNEEMQEAYGEFVKQIEPVSNERLFDCLSDSCSYPYRDSFI